LLPRWTWATTSTSMVTYDDRLAEAAEAAGILVVAPA